MRVFKKNGAWHLDYKDATGQRHRPKVGGSKRVAEEMLVAAIDRANREELGRFEASSISFADMAGLWCAGLRPDLKPATLIKWRIIVEKHLIPALRGMLRAVTVDAIEAYVKDRSTSGGAPGTINNELTVLRLIMRKAVEKHHLNRSPFRDIHGQPVESLRPLREPDARVRYLSPAELEKLLAACEHDPFLKAFVLVALNTGCRRNEVLNLRYSDIDWTNCLTRLTNTKTGRSRVVFLNPVALGALKSLPRRLDGKLWPLTPDQVSMRFMRAARAAGVTDFHLHDLRHTFCSYQAMAGVVGKPLSDLLGHRTAAMTDRYTHLSGEFLRGAVNRMQIAGNATAPDAAKA